MIRGLLIGAICEKSLQLPNEETSKQSAITLISADTERINLGLRNMHEVWANIIELAVAIYLLQREVGVIAVVPLFIAAGTTKLALLLLLEQYSDYFDSLRSRVIPVVSTCCQWTEDLDARSTEAT